MQNQWIQPPIRNRLARATFPPVRQSCLQGIFYLFSMAFNLPLGVTSATPIANIAKLNKLVQGLIG